MNPVLVGFIGLAVLLVLIFAGIPVGFSMGICGFLGTVYMLGFSIAVPQLHTTFYSVTSEYGLTVLPFFILMGFFASLGGATDELYVTAEKWLRRLPGGLALASIAGCAGFAAVCGSNMATTATMAKIALPQMKAAKYDDALITGTIASGGTLGALIPPSTIFVIYGIIAEESIGELLISGIIPGALLALGFMLIVVVRVKLNPRLAPINLAPVSWREKFVSVKNVWQVLLVFFMVIGGIYMGIFTPTEGGAVGAFILFGLALFRGKVTVKNLFHSMIDTSVLTAMIFFIIFGAFLFKDFLALSQIATKLGNMVIELQLSKYPVIVAVIVLLLVLGTFMPEIPMIMLFAPVVLPTLKAVGWDPIWFGVICVLMVSAGEISPPIGGTVFMMAAMAKDVPVTRIFAGALPFAIAVVALCILLIAFPQIALFLPRVMLK